MPINTCSKLPKPYALCRTFFFLFCYWGCSFPNVMQESNWDLLFPWRNWCLWTTYGDFEQLSLFFFHYFFFYFFFTLQNIHAYFSKIEKYLFGGLSMFFILKIYNNKILFWLLYRKTIENDFNEYYSVALRDLVFV